MCLTKDGLLGEGAVLKQTWAAGGRFGFLNKTLDLYSGQGRRLAQGSRISGVGGRIVPQLSSLRGDAPINNREQN